MKFRTKLLLLLIILIAGTLALFLGYPRGASLLFSFRKQCKVMRVEPFLKGVMVTGPGQSQKFSVVCDDGYVCRAEDTGFAGVKDGDEIEFRGFPEFRTIEEFGKCDHAQLIRIKPGTGTGTGAAPSAMPGAVPPNTVSPNVIPPSTIPPKAAPPMTH